MRGHVTKRGSTWTVVYDEGTGEDGKRRQRSKGGFATRREAESFLTDTLQRLDTGSYARPQKVTFADYVHRQWLPSVKSTIRPLTFKGYERVMTRNVIPGIGSVRLQSLSGGHINALYRQLEESGMAASTLNFVHAVLHRSLRDATRWGLVTRNAAAMADPPKASRSRAKAWTASELSRFLGHVAKDPLFALWRTAATTGMRRGELCGLTWRCLDLKGGRLTVEKQIVPARGGIAWSPPKSARSRRTIALDPQTVDALRRHRNGQLLERQLAGDVYEDEDLVFADPLGGAIRPDRLSGLFRKHRIAAGIPTGSLHTLRHTAATLALSADIPVHIVAARLGDNPVVVLRTYAHLLPQSDELAAERVAALLADVPL